MAYCFFISRLDLLDILGPALLLLETQRPASADGSALSCLRLGKARWFLKNTPTFTLCFCRYFTHFRGGMGTRTQGARVARAPCPLVSDCHIPPRTVPAWTSSENTCFVALQPLSTAQAVKWPRCTSWARGDVDPGNVPARAQTLQQRGWPAVGSGRWALCGGFPPAV